MTKVYGRVTFSNESGPIKIVDCTTEADYERELSAGAKWAASEPQRPLDVYGERFAARLSNPEKANAPEAMTAAGAKKLRALCSTLFYNRIMKKTTTKKAPKGKAKIAPRKAK